MREELVLVKATDPTPSHFYVGWGCVAEQAVQAVAALARAQDLDRFRVCPPADVRVVKLGLTFGLEAL